MNSFGTNFRVSIFGESHGDSVGVICDGVPAGIAVDRIPFTADLARRKSGALGTTARRECDIPQIISGVYQGFTTGSPLTIRFVNCAVQSADYTPFAHQPRPGHADFTAMKKFHGFNDPRGGGHFSGRLTAPLVAAGAVAKAILNDRFPELTIAAEPTEIAGISDKSLWDNALKQAIQAGDSVGGIITCRCTGVPVGLGEPFFDSVESVLAHGIFSIPGVRGVEFGDGFSAARMRGSQHNDPLTDAAGHTSRNGAGGCNGGISNGNPIVFRVAVKPTSSIVARQTTYHLQHATLEDLSIGGRHDCCIALRVAPIVEAVAALTLVDFTLKH